MNSSNLLLQEEPKPAGKQQLQAVTKVAASSISCSSDSSDEEVKLLLQHSRQAKQAKAQTDQRIEGISYFLRQQVFSNQCIYHSALVAVKKLSCFQLSAHYKLKQHAGMTDTLPWDWSLQSGHAENPEILGPPPSGH